MARDYHTPHETDTLLQNDRHNHKDAILRHLTTEIDPQHGDILLLFCYIITGLLDSSAVFIWGAFVSMQTGNTVYLGLGLTGAENNEGGGGGGGGGGHRWVKSAVSIVSFCFGSLCFGVFHHRSFKSPKQRWMLCVSFAMQMLCLIIAASIVTVEHPTKESQLTWPVLVPLGLVAFQSSGQAVISRVLKFNGLSSVVLTTVYCDLFSHRDFVSPRKVFGSVEERQRAGAVLCMFFGTLLGGLWAKTPVGMMGALWTAVLLKAFIVMAWLQWRGEKPTLDAVN